MPKLQKGEKYKPTRGNQQAKRVSFGKKHRPGAKDVGRRPGDYVEHKNDNILQQNTSAKSNLVEEQKQQ
jgi:hypothetical protein